MHDNCIFSVGKCAKPSYKVESNPAKAQVIGESLYVAPPKCLVETMSSEDFRKSRDVRGFVLSRDGSMSSGMSLSHAGKKELVVSQY